VEYRRNLFKKQTISAGMYICFKFMQSTKMKVLDKNYRTIWINEDDEETISIIDQRYLPHRFIIEDLHTVSEMVHAIKDMHVRGAGLIGAAAGYGMYLATLEARQQKFF
jgi:methylthioribose-1-phosphate isomerase